MKKTIFSIFLTIGALPIFAFAQTPATITINPGIPGISNVSTVGPCGWIVSFYTFALLFAGILAFGAIVYGGVRYATSAGNPSSQSEGRSWIWSALIGILLLAAAWLILNTVNPNLTKCSLPSLSGVANSGTATGASGGSGGTTQTGGGSTGGITPVSGVNGKTAGLQNSTVKDLNDLAANCHCNVAVTSGISGNHAQGTCSHSNGCKADIAPNSSLNSYITSLPPASPSTRSDGAALYQAPDGSIYANELTKPSNCGANCNWSGPHWDMKAGG